MDNSDLYEEELNRLREKEREQERLNKELFDKQIVPEIQSMLHGNSVDWNPWGYPVNRMMDTDLNNKTMDPFKWQDLLNKNNNVI